MPLLSIPSSPFARVSPANKARASRPFHHLVPALLHRISSRRRRRYPLWRHWTRKITLSMSSPRLSFKHSKGRLALWLVICWFFVFCFWSSSVCFCSFLRSCIYAIVSGFLLGMSVFRYLVMFSGSSSCFSCCCCSYPYMHF